jgi:hypothetical protein
MLLNYNISRQLSGQFEAIDIYARWGFLHTAAAFQAGRMAARESKPNDEGNRNKSMRQRSEITVFLNDLSYFEDFEVNSLPIEKVTGGAK